MNASHAEIVLMTGEKPEVTGATLLDEADRFIHRFCVLPTEADHVAVTLWAAHAHMVEHFHTTPRLALLSPEPGSGKTRVLEVLHLLTPETMFVFSASVAAIFRTMAQAQTTLLFDEVDAIFGRRGKDDQNEDLRALLNVGYRSGATIPRCVGPQHEVQHFNVFAAVALAGLGDLPDTVMTRSVIIKMRRRAPNEHVEPFRLRQHEPEGHAIRHRLAEWAASCGEAAGASWPSLPDGIVDRPAEVWEPLIAVADAAGGDWPQRARAACTEICNNRQGRGQSLGVRLLIDLRTVFAGAEQLGTDELLTRLTGTRPFGRDRDGEDMFLLHAPWANLKGAPLDARGLANLLRQYDVTPTKVRPQGGSPVQGYKQADLWDAWSRYAPTLTDASPEQTEQSEQTPRSGPSRSGCSGRSGIADPGETESDVVEL